MRSDIDDYKVQILDSFDLDIFDEDIALEEIIDEIIDNTPVLKGDGQWSYRATVNKIQSPNIYLSKIVKFD
jgi:hypothetical protein